MRNIIFIAVAFLGIYAVPLKKTKERGWENPILSVDLSLKPLRWASPGNYEPYTNSFGTFGLMVSLPPDYASNPTKRYPLVFFMVGAGESGSNPADTYKYGPNWALSAGWDGTVTLGDSTWRPIIVTYQPPSVSTSILWANRGIDTVLTRYRVDTMRQYISGLSMGAQTAFGLFCFYGTTGEARNWDRNRRWTSAVLFSSGGSIGTPANIDSLRGYARLGNLRAAKLYYTIGATDNPGYIQPTQVLPPMNNTIPGSCRSYRYTTPSGSGHCCWNYFYDPSWTDTLLGINIYQWMFQYTKYPSATAQNIINTSGASVTLNGVTSGWGKVISWTQLTGAASTISAPSSDTTNVTGLTNGTYTYRLRSRNGTGPTFVDHIVTVVVNTNNPNTPAGQFPKKKYQKFKMTQI